MTQHQQTQLKTQLHALGIEPGNTLMLHASMRAVALDADLLLDTLTSIVGPEGTLLVLLCAEEDTPFDPLTSPAWHDVGVLAEIFRQRPNVVVNDHPIARFGAWGRLAFELIKDPPLNDYYGPNSPLQRFHAHHGKVLRLGADMNTVTLLHWAEYLVDLPNKQRVRRTCLCHRASGPIEVVVHCLDDDDGIRPWPHEGDYFEHLLRAYLETDNASVGLVGNARSECIASEDLVAFAVAWMEQHLG